MKYGAEACTCVELLNEALAYRNGVVEVDFGINMSTGIMYPTLKIGVAKLDRKNRKKPGTLMLTYCPWCGQKIPYPGADERRTTEPAPEQPARGGEA